PICPCTPNTRRKSHRFQHQSGCVSFKTPLSKVDLYNLHLHHSVADFGEKTEKAADGWVFQIGVAQHIASAGDLQAAIPRTDLLGSVRNCEIRAHILNLRTFKPCFCDHLHRRPICSVKHQHTAGEGVCHTLHKSFDLLGQEIIEHAGGKEYRAV